MFLLPEAASRVQVLHIDDRDTINMLGAVTITSLCGRAGTTENGCQFPM